jgi:uncharacterized ion transporter superfamily protein YfcC
MAEAAAETKKPWYMKVPHTFTMLFLLIVICAIATHVLPAGEFQRAENPVTHKMAVVAGTYHHVAPSPVGFFDTFIAVQKGMIDAAEISFFIFIVYASFYTVLKTGGLHAFIGWLLRVMKGKEIVVIPVFMYLFGLCGAIFGMFEETFGFIPLFVGLAIAMGYDAIVGMCMVVVGVGIGFSAAFLNPFTVGLAQKFADLPLFSGMQFRIVSWFVFMTISIAITLRYAIRVKKDPTKSYVYGVDMGALQLDHNALLESKFHPRDITIMGLVVLFVGLLIWGVIVKGWYFNELAGLFLIMGISCAIVAGWGPNKIAESYLEGATDIVFGALVIGLSRGILIVMREGNIVDTIIYGLALPLQSLPAMVSAQGMLFVQTIISFFIPSGTGMAATTMPIMAPLADLLGFSRQVAVLAFQYGDGFSNIYFPTTLCPVICSIAKVPLEKWWKFFTPIFLLLYVVQMIFIGVAVAIGY